MNDVKQHKYKKININICSGTIGFVKNNKKTYIFLINLSLRNNKILDIFSFLFYNTFMKLVEEEKKKQIDYSKDRV